MRMRKKSEKKIEEKRKETREHCHQSGSKIFGVGPGCRQCLVKLQFEREKEDTRVPLICCAVTRFWCPAPAAAKGRECRAEHAQRPSVCRGN